MKRITVLVLFTSILFSCSSAKYKKALKSIDLDVIYVKDTQFFKGNKPYYFIGTNYWYGAILASKKSGDRERLIKELDLMQSIGINNLRILVGAEGAPGGAKVSPALQPQQGIYNEDLLDGLDFLMSEMRKRNMYAILYLNNNWIWSGGMSEYLKWNGYGNVPNPFSEEYSWSQFMNYTAQFHTCQPCKDAFYKHVKFIIGRKNNYSGIPYSQDNTIMSWQVANEPRVMVSKKNEKAYTIWLNETVDLIESLDSTHLISTGAEGKASYLKDIAMYKRTHQNPNIDYLTMHMWPKNWGWYDPNNEKESTDTSIKKANEYMDEHLVIARELNKPIVMSEFGFPRDNGSIKATSTTINRTKFYSAIFNRITESSKSNDVLSGLNFWGFGGYAITNSEDGVWRIGDDFTADPPQEPQGLNTVFASDKSILELIKTANSVLNN